MNDIVSIYNKRDEPSIVIKKSNNSPIRYDNGQVEPNKTHRDSVLCPNFTFPLPFTAAMRVFVHTGIYYFESFKVEKKITYRNLCVCCHIWGDTIKRIC